MDLGKIIKLRREELNLTIEQVANYTNVGKSTVSKWESGLIENMKRDKICSLSQILKVSPLTFIYNELILEHYSIKKEDNNKENLSKEENILIQKYRGLNEKGQLKIIETIEDLEEISRYKKDSGNNKFSGIQKQA